MEAIVCRDAHYYTGDYVRAVALVERTQDVEWNRVVMSKFGEAAMYSWIMKAVSCHMGNVTVPYTVMKYADPLLPSSGG